MSDIALLPSVQRFIDSQPGSFVEGQAISEAGAERFDVFNPSTGEVLTQVAQASPALVEHAVQAAHGAFVNSWGSTTPYLRGVALNRLADLIEANGEELAQLESLSSGKSIHLTRHLEVPQSVVFLRYFAGWATKIHGQTMTPSLPSMQGEQYAAFTRREAVGVVAGITPWNFSLMIGIWKIASALTCGCTIVLKPSEFTPLSLLRVAQLALEAGVPPGALNIVNGSGRIGQQLIGHPGVAKVSFTGSVPTGVAVGKAALSANLTRVTLELGGKNPAAFLADVDVDQAVEGILQTAYVHQGQVCAAPERLYIHSSKVDAICAELAQRLGAMKVGGALDESAQFGPLANKAHHDKIVGFFAQANARGQVLCGGKPLPGPGYFVEPTLLRATDAQDPFLHEETFGPIVTVLPFDDEDDLVRMMNDSPFGLGASVWTNDLAKAMRLIPRIEAGTVWVNMHTFLDPSVPFGGVKGSGIGREFGSAFIDDYTELKSVMMRF
ncbi:aldehyde dehydrogenase family protein [Pseudomonas sp. S36]|uniref:aldehyde dehydrogenase family protein n=1 Tax=Pseudomonas sp. S36 TaxID=2767447 RepID=UPI0019139AC7|nr:aldehyde dehydrogenase family protein [Pseudomonas sp. S36]MBK4987143.1 aldehyde dehydrogenase family protein [Pseudomonas sp. S36]